MSSVSPVGRSLCGTLVSQIWRRPRPEYLLLGTRPRRWRDQWLLTDEAFFPTDRAAVERALRAACPRLDPCCLGPRLFGIASTHESAHPRFTHRLHGRPLSQRALASLQLVQAILTRIRAESPPAWTGLDWGCRDLPGRLVDRTSTFVSCGSEPDIANGIPNRPVQDISATYEPWKRAAVGA